MAEVAEPERAVTLAQFAAVQAAEQDAVSVAEALRQVGIAPELWRDARVAILSDIASNARAFKAYQHELEKAQDALYRPVLPLYDDLDGWLGFSAAVAAGSTARVLEAYGMTMGDLGRLDRHWRRRLAQDRSLAKRARLKQDEALPIPAITVGGRSPGARHGTPANAALAAPQSAEQQHGTHMFEQAERTAILAALVAEGAHESALRRRGAGSRAEAESQVAQFTALVRGDAGLFNFYRQRIEHVRMLLRTGGAREPAAEQPASPSPSPPPWRVHAAREQVAPDPNVTAAVSWPVPHAEVLPYRPAKHAVAPALAVPQMPSHPGVGATQRIDPREIAAAMATPFAGDAAPPPSVLDVTAPVAGLMLDLDALPYRSDPDAPPPSLAVPHMPPSPDIGATAPLDPRKILAAATPFEDRPPVGSAADRSAPNLDTSFIERVNVTRNRGSDT